MSKLELLQSAILCNVADKHQEESLTDLESIADDEESSKLTKTQSVGYVCSSPISISTQMHDPDDNVAEGSVDDAGNNGDNDHVENSPRQYDWRKPQPLAEERIREVVSESCRDALQDHVQGQENGNENTNTLQEIAVLGTAAASTEMAYDIQHVFNNHFQNPSIATGHLYYNTLQTEMRRIAALENSEAEIARLKDLDEQTYQDAEDALEDRLEADL
ncbi:hypothetical protein BDR26DRAFT_941850 [Obelidium mucronatum]|nr:hypothetical protein BDR26DRAFT_941850 [Obelidium mucronatum]